MTGVKNKDMAFGDFTKLAEKYALYRPGYAPVVLDAFLALLTPPLPPPYVRLV